MARASFGRRAAAVLVALALGACATPEIESAPEPAASAPLTPYPGGRWEPGPARYGHTIVNEMPVTMDDGTVLRASVAWPTDPATGERAQGPFPVVLEHTPYATLGRPVTPNAFLVERGYIYAVVRARGTGQSGGEVANFSSRDGLDGKALVDWAAHRLEGSDGRVALLGCSYPGGLALNDLAALGPDSPVKAAVAACIGLAGGSREAQINSGMLTAGLENYGNNAPRYWGHSAAGIRFMRDYVAALKAGGPPAYDGPYWADRTRHEQAPAIAATGVPILLWTGWQDILEGVAVRTYTELQNLHAGRPAFAPMVPGQAVTPKYQLISGAWIHAAGLDAGIYLQWLETWLKGVDTGIGSTTTPAHLYEEGTERWVNLAAIPPAEQASLLHLGPDGSLVERGRGGGTATLAWGDPADPQSNLAFTSAPLRDGATLSGPFAVNLHASSSNTNLQVLAKLYDVAPDGTERMISEGAIMGSLRALDEEMSWRLGDGTLIWPWPTLERDEYLTPGEVYRFDIALMPRQWGVRPGHRLRLRLTTQSPRDICPEQGLPPRNVPDPCGLTAPQQATVPGGVYTVHFGAERPSALAMIRLPYEAFPEVRSGIPPSGWSESMRRMRDPAEGDELFSLPLDWGAGE